MIREWCDECGQLFPVRALGCPNACHFGRLSTDLYTVHQVAEAFWSAIAHERAKCEALREVERQVREEIAIRHMVGFGRGFTASDARLAEAPGIIVRQVTTKGKV